MLTVENAGALVESRRNDKVGNMAQVKITSATMINGAAVGMGEVVEIDDRLAKDLMRRGRAVPAGGQEKTTESEPEPKPKGKK